MSEETQNAVDLTKTLDKSDEEITNQSPADELSMLKERAKLMGIPVAGNIGVDTLRKRIADKLEGKADEEGSAGSAEEAPKAKSQAMTKAEFEQKTRDEQQRDFMKLIRCRIYNLNPAKNDLPGEIITVANRYVGTVRKFVPYGEGSENGYHLPKILFDDLKSRTFQQIITKTVKGQIEVKTRIVPEYNIVELPPLTEEELAELALTQQAAQRVNGE